MTQIKAQAIVARLSPRLPSDVLDDVRAAYGISETVRQKADDIRSNPRFSDEGKREQILAMLGRGPLAHHRQIADKIAARIAELEAERAKFIIAPDRTDLFGEMQRAEARAWLRTLPEIERIRVALESKEPTIRQAIAMAPAALSGVKDEIKTQVYDRLLAEKFGVKVENNAALIEGYSDVATAVAEAGNDIRRAAGISDRDFAALRAA
ncbi:hypothetical protein [uncultured Rhodoblastus sp.]|uniref:hypothetical protein n=1 Tax=uncultured Rhodoblastus sp. TaxID=543037 RepID=UPI0025F8BB7C|nr:hypothetical protein [uncultured Rhodoblastus sp.]